MNEGKRLESDFADTLPATSCDFDAAEEAGYAFLDLALLPPNESKETRASLTSRIDGLVIGRVIGVENELRVTFLGAPPDGVPARAMLTLTPDDIGRDVALMFEGGDPSRPIVMGRMAMSAVQETPPRIEAEVDNRRVEIEAQEQLVLRCGESSITLTRAGKIIIRGKYVLSQSAGVNRIQGGSVEIN